MPSEATIKFYLCKLVTYFNDGMLQLIFYFVKIELKHNGVKSRRP